MKTTGRSVIGICAGLMMLWSAPTNAHCDSLNGPVVKAAEKALATKDLKSVLIWVQKEDEDEIESAFKKTLAVRKLNHEAKELADRYFFETVVRVHRAGEGAAYTGLKPAGYKIDPAIRLADKALEEGNVEVVLKALQEEVVRGVKQHFEETLRKKNFDRSDVAAGREFVKAYVGYIHAVEGLHARATSKGEAHSEAEENHQPAAKHEH